MNDGKVMNNIIDEIKNNTNMVYSISEEDFNNVLEILKPYVELGEYVVKHVNIDREKYYSGIGLIISENIETNIAKQIVSILNNKGNE